MRNISGITDEQDGAGQARLAGNRFDRMEWAGAFGDLGTLIPFAVAYISLLKVDPYGMILAFGVANICVGLYYKTPMPVQPMKAIGAVATTQAAQTIVITPGAVYGAGLVTGIIWLVLGLTGAARKVADLVSRPVAIGIIMGLGFSFMFEGIKMMAQGWALGAIGLAGTLLLLTNRVVPVMFLLLLFGAAVAIFQNPALMQEFARMEFGLRLPTWQLGSLTWNELVIGTLFLALPQVPLTLGNAVIAITEENNRLFPGRAVSENRISVSTGLMNLFGSTIGAIPMCHGAGGMAGHVRFGAHTGGATIILGVFLVGLALFLSGSIETVFRIFPTPVLGVILFLTGGQLALGSCDFGEGKNDRFVTLTTAAFSMWNIGLAFLFGMALYHAFRKGWVKL
jgi:MFS superfamily sulfate permease-like transporter